mgnify:FL=1
MIHINPTTIDIALITGCITLIGLLLKIVARVTHFLDHLSAMLAVWEGTDAKPGVLSRLDDIETKLKDVQYHVKPNHGGSSFDAQNRQIAEILSYLRSKS